MNISRKFNEIGSGTNPDEIILRLTAMMRKSKILPGEQLPSVRDLAKSLGISTFTLRTNFRWLTAAGILSSRRGSGTFVVEANKYPSEESAPLRLLAELHGFTFDEMFEARLCIESCMAGLAAERATTEHLTLMMEEIIGMFSSIEKPDQFFGHQQRFNKTVAAAAGNRILTAMINMVLQIQFTRECQSATSSIYLKESAESHRTLYKAIRTGKPEKAGDAIRKHVSKYGQDRIAQRFAVDARINRIKTNGAVQNGSSNSGSLTRE